MQAQTEYRELNGYKPLEPAQTRGPVSTCVVKCQESDATRWIEAIDQAVVTPESFEQVRRQWQQNTRRQPIGVLKQHEFIDGGDRLTRVIDLPHGPAISECLFQRQFKVESALAIARSLTRCIEDLHGTSRVQGGLSGDCIFLAPENSIELREMEFFEGQFQPDLADLPTGSLILFAPEACGSLAREISPATDLYAVGALLFGMLAGRGPIDADNTSNYLDRQLCARAPRLRELGLNLPPALDDIVARLLQRDPRDRYETATGLLHDIDLVAGSLLVGNDSTSHAIGTQDCRTALTESNLVGRDDEIGLVQRALRDAMAGTPTVQLATGTESNDRQSFLDEVALVSKAQGMRVFRGGASTGEPKPLQSLQPVLATITSLCINDRALSKRLSESTREHGAALSELLPVLSGLWEHSDQAAGPDAYGSQRAAIALEELFAAFAMESPGVVYIFDDVDLADDITQTVVRSLAERARAEEGNLHLCMVASGEFRNSSEFCANDSVIELGSLSNEALTSYLRSSAGKLPHLITQSIVEVVDGDATMASTILRRMIDTGVVVPSAEGWQSTGPLSDSLQADECIAESLEVQLNALSSSALQTLMAAAVIGQQFRLRILSHLAETSYAEVLEVCSDALRRRLLWRDSSGDGFRFAHNAIHDRLRCRLDDDERTQLHLKAAAYLEQHDPSNVFELAIHYDAAGDRVRALDHSLIASRIARKKYSLSIAREHLVIAKRWLRSDDHETGLEIWEGLAEIELLSGRYEEAESNLQQALILAQPGFDMARVQLKIGELDFKRGLFVEAATEYEHALAMTGLRVPGNVVSMMVGLISETIRQTFHTWAPTKWFAKQEVPSEMDCLQLQLLSRLSHVYWFSRHKLWTLSNHLRSLNMAERFAPSETLAAVYSEHGPVMSLLRRFKRANRYATRSLTIRKELGDVWGQGQSHHYLSVVKLAECRFQNSIRSGEQAVELLRKMGDFWEMNMARYQAANAYYRIGNHGDATKLATQIFECGREIGDLQATGISLDVWARTSPHTLPLETAAREAAKLRPDAQSNAQTQLAYAIVLLFNNRTEEAIEVLESAIARSEAAGHLNTYISPCYAWLGTALRTHVEQTESRDGRRLALRMIKARKATEKATRIARGFPADRAHCFRELGLLYAIQGNAGKAMRMLNISLAASKRYDQIAEEWETLQCILCLHRLEARLLGNIEHVLQRRYDDLSESFGGRSHNYRAADNKSSNFSLADRFVTVLQSGRRIAQALSADVVYTESSEAARKLLRGQNVDVVTVDDHDGQLVFVTLSDVEPDDTVQKRIHAHDAIIRAAHEAGQAVCDTSPDLTRLKVGSAIAVPIAFRGTNVAVILVTHSELKSLFSTDEQRIADFVATLAGAALENADGFLRLRQLNDTLEQRVLDRTKAAEERAQQLAISNEQLRETEDQLREAIVHANAANEAKGRFLATISHEIRTPLNGILGMTRLARQSSADERQASHLETVQESGESLLTLINDLLDVSKLESGKVEIESIPMSPRSVAEEITRLMTASAFQRGVELNCSIDASVPETVLGDPSRIRQIVMNLIGNAIKFTEQGFVQLSIGFDQTTNLSIKVKDSGIGIPENRLDSVFESFSQVDSSTTRRYGGTGLGLAICRELAELMGGSIDVESEIGIGSEFTVQIPIQIDNTESVSAPSNIRHSSKSKEPKPTTPISQDSDIPIRILVAEDGTINQEVIVGMLEMNGYEVVVANDGEEALQKSTEGSFALCLMDVDMPKMDGIEATRMIRAKAKESDRDPLPIIAMTAHCGDQIWGECEAAGMNAYIPKPIDPETLFENIQRFQHGRNPAEAVSTRQS